jgi:hypothetical protein
MRQIEMTNESATMIRLYRIHTLICLWIVLLTAAGCGKVEPISTATGQRLKALAAVYLDYAAARGVGPLNEGEFMRHLRTMPAFSMGLDDVNAESLNELLISPRDKLPFAIIYGVAISFSKNSVQPIIAHEAVGEAGTRFVAYANGDIDCLDCDTERSTVLSSAKGI